jgi:hypothetical protein
MDVHLDCLDDNILDRSIIAPWSDLDSLYTIQGIFTADKFAKDSMFTIEVGRGGEGEEELRAVRPGTAVCHRLMFQLCSW